ncbi:PEP-CTERM sorting domain-containing protein [Akkermansiaceae bacterium]|nr:PEP-CTERM sorting domain-containing protein [Akkermansiaceae bacterium]MDB4144078.1 PEP-CTERM sorting domain-containing protein [Akkermansiaceae bacterium]MDB4274442.1 PEP-CTERM sorting domain-containing protein [Akkermansiaceae bacterium]MDB4771450.1 PEP-CTERM sorting domain-containing protein [Akkermansiaceae bacterium]
MKNSLLLGALALSSIPAATAASITYIDAVVSGMTGTVNTVGPSGTAASATAWQVRGTNGGTDTNNFGNEGSVLQYNTNPINAANPTLTTTLTGLDAGLTYRFYVMYWDDNLNDGAGAFLPASAASAWDVNAKLSTDAAYTAFDSTAAGSSFIVTTDGGLVGASATSGGYTDLTISELTGANVLGQAADDYTDSYDGNRALFGGALPTLATGATSYSIDIQAGTFNGQRSWYDGIGVEVVPEPSSALLIGLCGIFGLRRRR